MCRLILTVQCLSTCSLQAHAFVTWILITYLLAYLLKYVCSGWTRYSMRRGRANWARRVVIGGPRALCGERVPDDDRRRVHRRTLDSRQSTVVRTPATGDLAEPSWSSWLTRTNSHWEAPFTGYFRHTARWQRRRPQAAGTISASTTSPSDNIRTRFTLLTRGLRMWVSYLPSCRQTNSMRGVKGKLSSILTTT